VKRMDERAMTSQMRKKQELVENAQGQKIVPFLWFDNQAEEAAKLYTSVFDNSRILSTTRYGEEGPGPAGAAMTVTFELGGLEIGALNGGPQFKFTPATSFFVTCETEEEIDRLFKKLSDGGTILMPLQKYPFSEKFGWLNDKYGVSWQMFLSGSRQKITPFLMFSGAQQGKAEEAMKFYTSLYPNSRVINTARYEPGEGGPEGKLKHAEFSIGGEEFMAMDSGIDQPFTFTEAFSLMINCRTQAEVDELWEKLSAGGEKEVCGWLKDRYGVSWQVVPTILGEMLQDEDPEKAARVMKAMLQMTKIDIKALRDAYDGK
jgi:predicted 3-demethylubiquinone-9 3-methyltransferase (glyoxalase superfamily)